MTLEVLGSLSAWEGLFSHETFNVGAVCVFFFFFLLGGLGGGDKIQPLVVDSLVVFTSGYGRFFCPETCFIV